MSFLNSLFNKKELNTDPDSKEKEHSLFEAELDGSEQEESLEEENSEEESLDLKKENEQSEYEVVEREILPAKIICPDCGGVTLEGLEFCDKCGGEL
jgi:hypothetical protein